MSRAVLILCLSCRTFSRVMSASPYDGAGSEAAGQQVDPLKPGKGTSLEDASSATAAMQQAVQNGRQAVSGPDVPDPGIAPCSLAHAHLTHLCACSMQLYVWLRCYSHLFLLQEAFLQVTQAGPMALGVSAPPGRRPTPMVLAHLPATLQTSPSASSTQAHR